MYFLGIDLGSSSVKLSVLDADSGKSIGSIKVPEVEMEISAPKFGWAEQDPNTWWENVKAGIKYLGDRLDLKKIKGIGIAYQMHGLVITDEKINPLRPSIIWCDSRAVAIGEKTYQEIGSEKCQEMILGSPGNFTASKLKWVKNNEPEIFKKAAYMMLPGDYIAAKLSLQSQISKSGLSEAALWNFKENRLATEILDAMELPVNLIPEIVPNFSHQARIHPTVASELNLSTEAKITYRAGDQPNNALSLNTLNPGEVATTAGTSAVIYSVTENNIYDIENRINTFLHVNHSEQNPRNGVMLCINGSGVLYQWLRKIMSTGNNELLPYEFLNSESAKAKPGSSGLRFYPFGNGVERIFQNKIANSGIQNLNFNIHQTPELIRSACEGIVFAMNFGFDIMKELGASGQIVKAGNDNLFLSEVFRDIFVNTTQTTLELYDTNGADGAARGAAFGLGYYDSLEQAFENLNCINRVEPTPDMIEEYQGIYQTWKNKINIKYD